MCLHIVLVPLQKYRSIGNQRMTRCVLSPVHLRGPDVDLYTIYMLRYYPVKSNKYNFQYFAVQWCIILCFTDFSPINIIIVTTYYYSYTLRHLKSIDLI